LPGEERRHAGSGVAGKPGTGEGLVQLGLGCGVVRVQLDGEVPGPQVRFECGPGPRGVADEADFSGTCFELELRNDAGQAQCADRLDPRQRGIGGKLGGRFHSSRTPPRFAGMEIARYSRRRADVSNSNGCA